MIRRADYERFSQYLEALIKTAEVISNGKEESKQVSVALLAMPATWWRRYASELRSYMVTHNWDLIKDTYLQSDAWRWRKDAIVIELGSKCSVCGANGKLELHHASYASQFDEMAEDMQVLCTEHHQKGNVGRIPEDVKQKVERKNTGKPRFPGSPTVDVPEHLVEALQNIDPLELEPFCNLEDCGPVVKAATIGQVKGRHKVRVGRFVVDALNRGIANYKMRNFKPVSLLEAFGE